MGRDHILSAPWVLAFLMGLAGCGVEPRSRTVVVVVFDALHAGHVHHLGYERETTPNLDLLAQEGVTFLRALAPAPYTVASTASLMTGLVPQRHRVLRSFGSHLKPLGVTLAETLHDAGWQCFGATGNANAGKLTGITGGFDQWVEAYEGKGPGDAPFLPRGDGTFVHMVAPDWWVGHLKDILEQRDPKRDAFIYLHVLQPHSPYAPPERLLARFADPDYISSWSDEKEPTGFRAGSTSPLVRANKGQIPMNDADREYTRALYDASLLWGDEALGNMISLLRDKGLWDSSWLVVTSDHGEAFWQHGLWGHNDHLYEEMLHVPLVVRAPGDTLPKGTRVTGLVSPMDLFPSFMQWLDLPQVPDLDGQPLDPVIRGSAAKNRSMVLQSNGNRPDVGRTGEATKLIVGRGEGQGELRVQRYDLTQDPGEQSPLEGQPDEQVLARLVALMGSLEGYIAKEFERAEHKRVLRAHLELQLASELALDQAMQALGLKIPVGHAQRELRAAAGDLADVSALLEALGYGGDTEE
ncbi:MAG TPA: hypothetical protein EYQ25_10955 [Planctomycetes bacterium]|nr:hypothetical protein [Planctomycetota bacterium]HIL38507.1 hypothetical protein [Planctomycetota bacterium]